MPVGEDRSADQQRHSRDRKPRSGQEHPDHRPPALKPGLLRRTAEMYLNCPRCGLGIAQTARSRPFVHCPRCLGRARTRVELFASTLRAEQLYADGAPWAHAGTERDTNGANAHDNHTDRGRRPGRVLLGSATKKRVPVIEPAPPTHFRVHSRAENDPVDATVVRRERLCWPSMSSLGKRWSKGQGASQRRSPRDR